MGDTPHYTRDGRAEQTAAPSGDLADLLAAAQARWGLQALRPLRQLPAPPRRPTGYPALDVALRGGWPVGRLTALHSRLTSGATALALASLRAGQRAGRRLAVIDPLRRFDPALAAAGGLALDAVWLARPDTPADAAAVAGWLAQSGQVSALVWLGADPRDPVWSRLTLPLAEGAVTALAVVYAPLPPTSPLAHSAAAVVAVRQRAWLRRRGDVVGVRAHLAGADGQPWGEASLVWEPG